MKVAYSEYGGGSDTHLHPCLETSKGPSVGIVNYALAEIVSLPKKKISPTAESLVTSAVFSSIMATVKPHTVAFPYETVLKNSPTASSL